MKVRRGDRVVVRHRGEALCGVVLQASRFGATIRTDDPLPGSYTHTLYRSYVEMVKEDGSR